MKKILWALPVLILVSLLPAAPPSLTFIGGAVQGAHVAWPLSRYLLEPLSGAAGYLLSFSRYLLQLASWLFWLAAAAVLCGLLRGKGPGAVLRNVILFWASFLTLAVAVVLLPTPAPRLVTPADVTAVDLHSHTWYSHDSVKSPGQSLSYHRKLGFDRFFVTEHGRTNSFLRFPEGARLAAVLPGMQISTTERISLLVLADRPFDAASFKDRTVKEVIDLAHANGFVVICPHWWKWRHFTWEDLRALGIDGFEVYNAGYRNFPEDERGRLVAFCREKKLLIAGSTDWHGWGSLSNVWTLAPLPKDEAGPAPLFRLLRGRAPFTVAVYGRPEAAGSLRLFFEPFYGLYYYFGSLDAKQLAGWALWILAAALLRPLPVTRRIIRLLPLFACLGIAALAVYSLAAWFSLRPGNEILGRLLVIVLSLLSAGWYFIWRIYGKTAHPS